MPWITDITAIRVVVARMIPSNVRKLRSLLERNESAATDAASRMDAVWATLLRDEAGVGFVPYFANPLYENRVQPKARFCAGDEAEMTAVIDRE